MFSREERVAIFMSRFKGRSDVFARRWEKWGTSVAGYTPVYTDTSKTAYVPLTPDWVEKHLIGTATLGVYPLLPGNVSYFIAADFDGGKWKGSLQKFVRKCKEHGLPIAVERSRSGNGGHVWCFFKEPYLAYKSRRIFQGLLREAGVINAFDKNESFDRLFPNQDALSGKGLGNLIAFPLQGTSRKSGNSVFVDCENDFEVIEDQWQFLHDMPLTETTLLDSLYTALAGDKGGSAPKVALGENLTIERSNMLTLPRHALSPNLTSFLREELNLVNIEYVVKERAGLPTYGSKKFIKTIEEKGNLVSIPRGFLEGLCKWLEKQGTPYVTKDLRTTLDPVSFTPRHELFPFQQMAVTAFEQAEEGILVSPAGSGKTIMGLSLIAQKKQPAIILTHRRQIFDQWIERIEQGLGIPKTKIGQICSTKKESKHPITVAMVQTLARLKDWGSISDNFGTILVDECHHMPARMFRDVVSKFKGRFLFGLTATPDRKYNDAKLISIYLGPVIHTVHKEKAVKNKTESETEVDTVLVRETAIKIPFAKTSRDFPLVSKALSNDTTRNAMITEDIAREAKNGKKCLALTERKEHAEMLQAHLAQDFEVVLFSGDLSATARKRALQKIKSDRFQILVATGQILGEGTDITSLDKLFLTFPVSFHGKLAQYIGRICRNGGAKMIYDYRDIKVPILEKMWKKRASYYRKTDF